MPGKIYQQKTPGSPFGEPFQTKMPGKAHG
jgi:hypothetical protein